MDGEVVPGGQGINESHHGLGPDLRNPVEEQDLSGGLLCVVQLIQLERLEWTPAN